MRPTRHLLILSCLMLAGIAALQPEAARGLITPVASPAHADPAAEAPAQSGSSLPGFVPGSRVLSFDSDGDAGTESDGPAPATAGGAAAAADAAPATAAAAPEPVPPAPVPAEKPARQITITVQPDKASPGVELSVRTPGPARIDALPDKTIALAPDAEPPPEPPVVAAKSLFGVAKTASPLAARAIGTYARGCLSGAVALPTDGPAWQAMRLSRNRQWGHPELINLVERFAKDAQKLDGWPGLLVGDISQPRGGPMLTGHASHQIGLDADVWLTPMPDRKLTAREREDISATSMLDKTDLAVDPAVFTDKHVALIKRAASYPQVERVLVHPAIKKALCQSAGEDRKWLGKVRPIGGHYYHFHIRIGCPAGYAGCKPQTPPTGEDGCTKEVEEWLARLAPSKTPPPPKPPGWKPKPPAPPITLAQLPQECTAVLEAGPGGVSVPPAARPLTGKATVAVDRDAAPQPAMVFAPSNASAALRPHLRKAEQSPEKR